MITILWVGVGGFIGSILRYSVYLLVRSQSLVTFPLATLLVNTMGCILIGIATTLDREFLFFQKPVFIFISVGILGGFTTFSAFGLETVELFRLQRYGLAFLNIFSNLILGFGGVFIGRLIATKIVAP